MGTHIVVFDERSDASQTRFEGRKCIGRLLSDIEEHLRGIDNPLSLRCGESVELGPQPDASFLHGPDSIPVPLAPRGRFRKMLDMILRSSVGSSSSVGLGYLHHEDIARFDICIIATAPDM